MEQDGQDGQDQGEFAKPHYPVLAHISPGSQSFPSFPFPPTRPQDHSCPQGGLHCEMPIVFVSDKCLAFGWLLTHWMKGDGGMPVGWKRSLPGSYKIGC